MKFLHVPVMVEEVLDLLRVRSGGTYIDGTLGDGGHAEAILERSAPAGRLLAMDRDAEAIKTASARLARFGQRIVIEKLNFSRIKMMAGAVRGEINGILLDLGVSTRQLLGPGRGFSLSSGDFLDMRMDRSQSMTAFDVINGASEKELVKILRNYGEEWRWARRVSVGIVREREIRPIKNARQLVDIVLSAIPRKYTSPRIHPATRIFQAFRIAVNKELDALERVLPDALDLLRPTGRLAVISFHSLEDRIVKRFFAERERGCICPPKIPYCQCGRKPVLKRITKKVICPGEREVRKNPRSRSAKLRVAEKL